MKTKKEKQPKRLTLDELAEKHGAPKLKKIHRDLAVIVAGGDQYRESTRAFPKYVIRKLRVMGVIKPSKDIVVGCGGVIWEGTEKAIPIAAMELENREQRRLGHGLVSAT